jgi:hypothetical protein
MFEAPGIELGACDVLDIIPVGYKCFDAAGDSKAGKFILQRRIRNHAIHGAKGPIEAPEKLKQPSFRLWLCIAFQADDEGRFPSPARLQHPIHTCPSDLEGLGDLRSVLR